MRLFKAGKDAYGYRPRGLDTYEAYPVMEGTLILADKAPSDKFTPVDLEQLYKLPLSEGILKFNLDDHYEKENFENSIKGPHYKMKIDSWYDDVVRPIYRYDKFKDKELTKGQREIVEHLIKELNEHFNED